MRKFVAAILGCLLAFVTLAAHGAAVFEPFEPDGMERIVASQKGKPFVLVVWSLECEYCQASLAALAQETRTRKDLRVVTLSTDAIADRQIAASMRRKLAAFGMHGNAWAFGSAPPEQLRYAIDPKWHGELPRSYWFNARGEKIGYSGALTHAVIAKLSRQSASK